MITPCPFASEACPYYGRDTPKPLIGTQEHGCYSDTDHLLPRAIGHSALSSPLLDEYINTPANKVQRCRWEHDAKTGEDQRIPPQIPTERFIMNAIKRARSRQ